MSKIEECRALLSRWDAGEEITSIDMSGFGGGYEQSIHVTVFELLRHYIYDVDQSKRPPLAQKDFKKFGKWADVIAKQNAVIPDGHSGASWGASVALAWQMLSWGPEGVLAKYETDRRLKVKNGPVVWGVDPYQAGLEAGKRMRKKGVTQ